MTSPSFAPDAHADRVTFPGALLLETDGVGVLVVHRGSSGGPADLARAAGARGMRVLGEGAATARFGTRAVDGGGPPTVPEVLAFLGWNDGPLHEPLTDAEAARRLVDLVDGGSAELVRRVCATLVAGASCWDLATDVEEELAADLTHFRPPPVRRLPVGTSGSSARLSALGLPGVGLPDSVEWCETDLSRIGAGRCSGLVAEAMHRGLVGPDAAVAERWTGLHRAAQAACLILERELLRLIDELEGAGLHPVVLKGPVSVHDGPLPEHLRDFGDVDLLVPPDEVDTAVALLGELGYERRFRRLSRGFDAHFSKSVTLRGWTGGTPMEVDLHRTLTPGPFGELVHLDSLHREAVPVRVHGRWVRGLHPRHRFLHSAFHIATGNDLPRLSALRDFALWAPPDAALAGEAMAEGMAWRASAVLARATSLAAEVVPLPAAWMAQAATLRVGRRDRWLLGSYHHRRGNYGRPALATLAVLPDSRTRLRFLLAHLPEPLGD